MLTAVEFNNEPFTAAYKVCKIRTNGKVPHKFEAAEPLGFQLNPQQRFGVIVGLAKLAGKLDGVGLGVHGKGLLSSILN